MQDPASLQQLASTTPVQVQQAADVSSSRYRSAVEDLSSVTEENRTLKQRLQLASGQLQSLQAKCDQLTHQMQQQQAAPAPAATHQQPQFAKAPAEAVVAEAAAPRANLWLMVIVAIVAFLIGHLT